jgi:copper chaperone
MVEATFKIDGMSCGGCVRRVSSLLQALPGVQVEAVSVGSARVRLDPARTTQIQLVKALGDAGYVAKAS